MEEKSRTQLLAVAGVVAALVTVVALVLMTLVLVDGAAEVAARPTGVGVPAGVTDGGGGTGG